MEFNFVRSRRLLFFGNHGIRRFVGRNGIGSANGFMIGSTKSRTWFIGQGFQIILIGRSIQDPIGITGRSLFLVDKSSFSLYFKGGMKMTRQGLKIHQQITMSHALNQFIVIVIQGRKVLLFYQGQGLLDRRILFCTLGKSCPKIQIAHDEKMMTAQCDIIAFMSFGSIENFIQIVTSRGIVMIPFMGGQMRRQEGYTSGLLIGQGHDNAPLIGQDMSDSRIFTLDGQIRNVVDHGLSCQNDQSHLSTLFFRHEFILFTQCNFQQRS
mmetsp:Transcript_20595/g.43156  ORF Transcript_20595/g.43156 Transcript_20595/m.43156 type:complete len:267 (+) Transcript_20595:775-1575(+)